MAEVAEVAEVAGPDASLAAGAAILYREAAYLDDRRWDDWLALYATDCEYWVPTWRTEEELATNPQSELSHIYYASRAGLEDRIVRINSRRSPASMPIRRTTHLIANVLLLSGDSKAMQLRSSWTCHVFDPHHKNHTVLFGSSEYTLRAQAASWLISKRKTIIQNDYLPAMVDVYCI